LFVQMWSTSSLTDDFYATVVLYSQLLKV